MAVCAESLIRQKDTCTNVCIDLIQGKMCASQICKILNTDLKNISEKKAVRSSIVIGFLGDPRSPLTPSLTAM